MIEEELLNDTLKNVRGQLKRDATNLVLFGWIYQAYFEKLDLTFENSGPENIYYFSDNSGGYTGEGIKDSIAEFLEIF